MKPRLAETLVVAARWPAVRAAREVRLLGRRCDRLRRHRLVRALRHQHSRRHRGDAPVRVPAYGLRHGQRGGRRVTGHRRGLGRRLPRAAVNRLLPILSRRLVHGDRWDGWHFRLRRMLH